MPQRSEKVGEKVPRTVQRRTPGSEEVGGWVGRWGRKGGEGGMLTVWVVRSKRIRGLPLAPNDLLYWVQQCECVLLVPRN